MTNQQKLSKLKRAMIAANLPLKESAQNIVFGSGNPNVQVIFIGEAPGRNEDETGEPFVGQAGRVLNQLLEIAGLKREEVFITSVVKYRPPNNRPPKPHEIATHKPYLEKQIEILKPQVIVTLGRFALEYFQPESKISQVHGVPQQLTINNRQLTLLPMYHPSAAFRRLEVKKAIEEDFKKNANLLNN